MSFRLDLDSTNLRKAASFLRPRLASTLRDLVGRMALVKRTGDDCVEMWMVEENTYASFRLNANIQGDFNSVLIDYKTFATMSRLVSDSPLRIVRDDKGSLSISTSGSVVNCPAYQVPEQLFTIEGLVTPSDEYSYWADNFLDSLLFLRRGLGAQQKTYFLSPSGAYTCDGLRVLFTPGEYPLLALREKDVSKLFLSLKDLGNDCVVLKSWHQCWEIRTNDTSLLLPRVTNSLSENWKALIPRIQENYTKIDSLRTCRAVEAFVELYPDTKRVDVQLLPGSIEMRGSDAIFNVPTSGIYQGRGAPARSRTGSVSVEGLRKLLAAFRSSPHGVGIRFQEPGALVLVSGTYLGAIPAYLRKEA